MSDFTFSGTVECERCGTLLSSSSEDCSNCSPDDLSRYHFLRVTDGATEVTWSISPVRAWYDLMKKVDDPLPWRCEETGDLTVDAKQRGIDVVEIHNDG